MINFSVPKKYRNQKQRSIFAITGFRGLDKENKPVKVQPFRATDGHNFIIDSDTLKTRPSYKIEIEPTFVLESGDYIIDWYLFEDIRVYVTRRHFYFERNGVAFNEQALNSLTFSKGGIASSFDFANNKPHFQEEKECLFIFCLNAIYVVSKIQSVSNTRIIFYELNSKPINPYNPTFEPEAREEFEDLPIPYEPTVFLDERGFDDVNLLSPVAKYRLFAASQNTHNGETTYTLPTHYNSTKHGSFSPTGNTEVTFYKDRYGRTPEVLPVFIGIEKDNFPVLTIVNNTTIKTLLTYGTSFLAWGTDGDNTPEEIPDDVSIFAEIRDIYYPPTEFSYFGTSSHQQHAPISENYGLTKDKFFKMVVKDTEGITVFQYLMDYISNNSSLFTDANFANNKWVAFKMNANVSASFYDNNSSVLKERAVLNKNVLVYVQLRKYEKDQVAFVKGSNPTTPAYLFNSTITAAASYPPPFSTPVFPTTAAADHTFYINEYNTTDSLPTLIPEAFNSQEVEAFIREKADGLLAQKFNSGINIINNQTVRIFGKFYQLYSTNVAQATANIGTVGTSTFQFNQLAFQSEVTYPAYPTTPVLTNPITVNVGFVETGNRITFASNTAEYTALKVAIEGAPEVTALPTGTHNVHVRAYGFKSILDENGDQMFFTFAVSVIAVVEAVSSVNVSHRLFSASIRGAVSRGITRVKDSLYKIEMKEEDNELRFTLKDYFFDFNNEPTIEIKTRFNTNTDYSIITKSTFGITFGSENRLFLAGNPDTPNIDRFNVSNDLLGNGNKNQSYELTYFPSKNYRVLGGKGAINGYVVATDSELYVTKEEYPNDDRFFIRQRALENNGIVGYKEFKTNIRKTPINNRCIVRFYNDILMLSEEGLYGIEISSNVLTNERLLKLRSGFINEELKKKIAAIADKQKIFMVENDRLMYIFVGKEAFVADSRYTAQNPNSEIENLSYEMVKWTSEVNWFAGKADEGKFYLIEENGGVVYSFAQENFDEYGKKEPSFITSSGLVGYTDNIVFNIPSSYNYIFASAESASNYAFVLPSGYKVVGDAVEDYTESSGTVTVIDTNAFAPFTDGSELFWETTQNSNPFAVTKFTIAGFEASNRTTFTYGATAGYKQGRIYQNIAGRKLYITHFWQINNVYSFRLSPLRPTSATRITQNAGEAESIFRARIAGLLNEDEDYYFSTSGAMNALVVHVPFIDTKWVSAISDFGNNIFEKTSFRVNIYATKQPSANNMTLGYRTLRRLAGLSSPIDLSNEFNLQDIDYSQFSLATMDTVGFSLPMKENNFLYIQFTINGKGKIELNAIEVSYKLNRMLKSVG